MYSTKYDGSLHYRYPVQLVERSADRLITWAAPGTEIHSYRGSWMRTKHTLSVFLLGRPYVLHAMWDAAWQPHWLYVDIATDTRWTDDIVQYVDMDLDLILNHNSPEIILDDEDEFAAHREKFGYPSSLVSQCHAAVEEVRRLLESRESPFTPALFAWRPGAAAPS
ncbi:MAG TPA: DUF402 domain-containing protein [Tepidisphaeraceae bacterium]|nr:DUF402 domain-containing protein [Tepidisphaeraceae bacterium]